MPIERLLLSVLILNVGSLLAQNPYEVLQYDSLVIYDFDWRGQGKRHQSILEENGQLPPTVKKSVTLSKNEALELSRKIGEKSSYGQITAACFDPHFGMIYYKAGAPIEHITICLSCNFPQSSKPIPARNQGPEAYEDEVYYTKTGFSKTFRRYLSELKKRHGFSSAELNSQMFDQ